MSFLYVSDTVIAGGVMMTTLERNSRNTKGSSDYNAGQHDRPSGFSLGKRSVDNLAGVHPDLQALVYRCITLSQIDFFVNEGVRTLERQRSLLELGVTKTLNSRHLTGHAVDLVALKDGRASWEWPDYRAIADAMKASSSRLGVPVEWGGDWKSLKDGPHFQLPWESYPL
ncbi:M15 family metallopeptidase [Halomonas denitrificans]|uniref:M15 family metallopeptidase n=1 Tax=Halomonas denitrificans TaxID=370769 RepID=UPI0021BD6008|nr:M15 family metallopeptidase [Halomonas denitrificans]